MRPIDGDRQTEATGGIVAGLASLHYESMLRFAYLLTGGRDHEDLVHDAFIRALARWDRDAAPETFRPWMQTTMLRLHLSRLRRLRRERRAYESLDSSDEHHDAQAEPDVLAALRALPPRQRAAVVLRYYEDLSEREMAERLGCRPGTVKALLHQARQRLRDSGVLE